MLTGLTLRRPNPFAVPGSNPGFDPTHVALSNGKLFCSAVASGANFIDVITAKAGTIAGAPTAKVLGPLGPVTDFGIVNGPGTSFTGKSTAAQSQMTLACIVWGNSWGGSGRILASTAMSTNAGFSLGVSATPVHFTVTKSSASTVIDSGILLAQGVPYFLALSINSAASNFVTVDLRTGSVQTASGTGLTSETNTGGFGISNNSVNATSRSAVAAAMAASSFLSVPQLLQWAQDPWAFWYPRKLDLTQMLVGASGAFYTLAAALGTYSMAGKAATPNAARSLSAAQGAYALSGKAATINRGINIAAAQGSFTINGQAASLPRGRTITAAQGTFTVAGQAASLPRGRMIVAAQGSFTQSGNSVTFPVALSLKTPAGAYSLNGQGTALAYAPVGAGNNAHTAPFLATPGSFMNKP